MSVPDGRLGYGWLLSISTKIRQLWLLAPILVTDDMAFSVRFFVDVLGFTCGIGSPGYSKPLSRRGADHAAAPNAHQDWNGSRFIGQVYIGLHTADDVDALWEDRAAVVDALGDFSYGSREFGIRDDNGYALAFDALSRSDYRAVA